MFMSNEDISKLYLMSMEELSLKKESYKMKLQTVEDVIKVRVSHGEKTPEMLKREAKKKEREAKKANAERKVISDNQFHNNQQ